MLHIENVKQYDEIIAKGEVLVDFFAVWCGPCQMLSPVLEDLDESKEWGEIQLVKVDTDELPELAIRYGISSIPTLLYFKDGQLVNKALGYMRKDQILKFLNK